jgi:hypothetical protein
MHTLLSQLGTRVVGCFETRGVVCAIEVVAHTEGTYSVEAVTCGALAAVRLEN